ncbi:hypothetical protein EOPP23_04735 [Endozoicomonas sp. OPT23]|uniref:DUF4019 domain-containing protein n=1 Tax=Endozoicomonas sp. OPT23 TaxID=2072845 RepID=UPI00129B66C2|nr:DUF4019 domain-containing protein [Endozoicomonas sp. OPT23]MRI32300.1 hypothetical protein [Endozoicomonas sp. OPT23]
MFARVSSLILLCLMSMNLMAMPTMKAGPEVEKKVLTGPAPKPATESDKKIATASAQKWLEYADTRSWERAWAASSDFYRNEMPVSHMGNLMYQHRKPFGALKDRKVKNVTYKYLKEGTLPGEYLIVAFDSEFENQKVVEVVVTYKEKDNLWRASGYMTDDGKGKPKSVESTKVH